MIYKTVCQYSKTPIPSEDMAKLQEIAKGYCQVKNYVYARYGGIGSLTKLYPGYTIQNEMSGSGLRDELGLPSVYFYLAIFDALGDIKAQWTRTKTKVLHLIGQNENLTNEEKHYLRFVLKFSSALDAVWKEEPVRVLQASQQKYEDLASAVDVKKMHRYLCRQIRRYHVRQLHTDLTDGFFITKKAYRYADGGIYIATKQSRKRVFVPLTDHNSYQNQLYVKLCPETGRVEVKAPICISVRSHEDYMNAVGLSMGMFTMLMTDEGRGYGEQLGKYQEAYTNWLREQAAVYQRNQADNPGRKKYNRRKHRYTEQIHSYINQELNRFLREEKPAVVYIAKLPPSQTGGPSRRINRSVTLWQRGYIRKRLVQKCREQSVEFVEVLGKGISTECSRCGMQGVRKEGIFSCPNCGCSLEEKTNAARNAKKRGIEGKQVR